MLVIIGRRYLPIKHRSSAHAGLAAKLRTAAAVKMAVVYIRGRLCWRRMWTEHSSMFTKEWIGSLRCRPALHFSFMSTRCRRSLHTTTGKTLLTWSVYRACTVYRPCYRHGARLPARDGNRTELELSVVCSVPTVTTINFWTNCYTGRDWGVYWIGWHLVHLFGVRVTHSVPNTNLYTSLNNLNRKLK